MFSDKKRGGVKMLSVIEYLKKHPEFYDETQLLLPLMHSCECFNARSIITQQKLKTSFCNVMGKKLLYFYYGKPSYPVGEKQKNSRTDFEYCPVCFIVDLRKVLINKVYPFDSGAYKKDLYEGFIHRHMTIDNFEIDGNEKGIKTYLSFMFGNIDNYFYGAAIKKELIGEPYIDALINIMTAKGSMKFDERGRTIEIISESDLNLKDALKCIILPQNLLQDDKIATFLHNNNIDVIDYGVRALVSPTGYYELIVEKAIDYIKRNERGY